MEPRRLVAAIAVILVFALAWLLGAAPAGAQTFGDVNAQRFVYRLATNTIASNGTGTAASGTITVNNSSYTEIDCQDPDGCTITVSETGAREGQTLTLVNVGSNTCTYAYSSGVLEIVESSYSQFQYYTLTLQYIGDRWVEMARSVLASGAAGSTLGYITKTAEATLSNEFALGSLATGILKNTTTTGVPTIAVSGTDYVPPGAITSSSLTMATARVLGRTTASTGAVEELTSVPMSLGGTGLTTFADDTVPVSNGSVFSAVTIDNCNDTTEKLDWDGTQFLCIADQTAAGAGSGDFVGPGGSTDNAIVRFDSTTGKLGQNSSITIGDTGALGLPDGIKQTFNPDGTTAGLNVGSNAGDPSALADGDVWYNSTSTQLKARINGASVALGAGGGGAGDLLDVQWVRKVSDETVTTDTTLQADDEFVIPVGANEVWDIEFVLYVDSNTTADFKVSMTSPTGTTGYFTAFKNTTGDPSDGNYGSNASSNIETGGAGFTAVMGAPGAIGTVVVRAIVMTAGTSGNVTLIWAQAVSSSTTTVKARSFAVARQYE
jgi:hypothetical protein